MVRVDPAALLAVMAVAFALAALAFWLAERAQRSHVVAEAAAIVNGDAP